MENTFKGKKITVMGLGFFGGGVAVTRFLARQGAQVTLTDLKDSAELADSLKLLDGLPIQFVLGEHRESDFRETDMLVVNPAVPKNSPFIQIAKDSNVPLETEMNIFFKLCPAPIIGITGTNGKSTTTSFLSGMLQNTGRKTWTGGNIGYSLLEHIEEINPGDIAVLELSSFQLEDLQATGKSPHIGIVTNIAPNHLDRHKDMQDYINAKKGMLRYQKATDYTILNHDDPELRGWAKDCTGKVVWFSAREKVNPGAYMENNQIVLNISQFTPPQSPPYEGGDKGGGRNERQDADSIIMTIPCMDKVKLPGIHNAQNVLAAATAASIMGAKDTHIAEGATSFAGLEHRLEFVSEIDGIRHYNDSKATTPESAIAAINAFNGPANAHHTPRVVLIAGGYDKGASFDRLAEECVRRTKSVILIGKTSRKIASLITTAARGEGPEILLATSLKDAVEKAKDCANAGDVILLSPACASYDMFVNYEERGGQFKALCNAG